MKVVKEAFDQAAKLYRETTVFTLPDSNGGPMVKEQKIATPSRSAPVKRKAAKPKKKSIFDFFRE